MKRIFFISDVHLGADSVQMERVKHERLSGFLDYVRDQADVLYIVGDFFDFWFEYRQAIPKTDLRILSKLVQLVEAGIEVHYLTGNHDLWLDSYFENAIGLTIHHRPLVVSHNSLNLYIAHGDGLIKGDYTYRVLKRIFQNGINVKLFRLLHPDIGIPLAKYFSRKSREKGENRFDEEYRTFALKKLQQRFDAVILGHTHKPLFQRIGEKYYVNLGDWFQHFTYLEMSGKTLSLDVWEVGKQELHPRLEPDNV